jgi:hypothetical protein
MGMHISQFCSYVTMLTNGNRVPNVAVAPEHHVLAESDGP